MVVTAFSRVLDGESERIAGQSRERQTSALLVRPLDAPFLSVMGEGQPASRPPPAVDLTGQGNPDSPCLTHRHQVLEQCLIGSPSPLLDDVVGMHEEGGQAVLSTDRVQLPLPQANRIVVQDME